MATAALIALLPLLAAANPLHQLAARECQHNNCVRAVIASAFPSRPASADCASFLKTTVTPVTRTVTATLTFSEVAGTTQLITAHETIAVTNTRTDKETATQTAPTVTVTVPTGLGVSRRQVTVSPTLTPSYASVCSNTAKYASACSCAYGLVPTVITADAPVTTVTVSNTLTVSTKTDLATVATETVTLSSSKTITIVDNTVTLIPTATAYIHLPPSTKFRLRVRGGPLDGLWVSSEGGSPWVTDNIIGADTFDRDDSTGYIKSYVAGKTLKARKYDGSSIFYDVYTSNDVPIKCNVDSTLALQCNIPGSEMNTFGYCPSQWLTFVKPGQPGGCRLLEGDLVVVPL